MLFCIAKTWKYLQENAYFAHLLIKMSVTIISM